MGISYKIKFLVFILMGFVLVVLLAPKVIEGKIPAEKCVSCHALEESKVTWSESSHSKINCVKCHGAVTITQIPSHTLEIFENTVTHVKNIAYTPKLTRKIQNEVCVQCHTENRRITPTGDLIIPHEKHRGKNIACVRCHTSVGHGETLQIKMTACMKCHEERKVSHECTVCHSNIQVPDNHLIDTWKEGHGISAFKNVKDCARCHAYYDLLKDAKGTPFQIAGQYAKGNPYCLGCHSKKPTFHISGWLPSHPFYTQLKGMRNCLACHYIGDLKQKKSYATNIVTGFNVDNMDCNKCHLLDPKTEGEAACNKCHAKK